MPAALHKLGGYEDALAVLALYARDPSAANARWGERWAQWWRDRPGVAEGDAPWDPQTDPGAWRAAPRALGNYREWGAGTVRVHRHAVVSDHAGTDRRASRAERDAGIGRGRRDRRDLGQRTRDRQQLWRRRAQLRLASWAAARRPQQHRGQRGQHLCRRRPGRPGLVARVASRRWHFGCARRRMAIPRRSRQRRHAAAGAMVVGIGQDHAVQRHGRAFGALRLPRRVVVPGRIEYR